MTSRLPARSLSVSYRIAGDHVVGAKAAAGLHAVAWADPGRLGVGVHRTQGLARGVKAGQIVFSLEDNGELIVGRLTATAFEPLHRYQVADSDVSTLTLWTIP